MTLPVDFCLGLYVVCSSLSLTVTFFFYTCDIVLSYSDYTEEKEAEAREGSGIK